MTDKQTQLAKLEKACLEYASSVMDVEPSALAGFCLSDETPTVEFENSTYEQNLVVKVAMIRMPRLGR